MPPAVSKRYVYKHPDGHGLGQHHADNDLIAEMRELDLADGTEVTIVATDEESAWPIVGWTDSVGTERLTTIDPATFSEFFTEA